MSESRALKDFFVAWGKGGTGAARSLLEGAVGPRFWYADPNVPVPIESVDAMVALIANFPPGASAAVIEPVDIHHGHARANVAFDFGGGKRMVGQYFAELNADGRIARIAGFPGKGAE